MIIDFVAVILKVRTTLGKDILKRGLKGKDREWLEGKSSTKKIAIPWDCSLLAIPNGRPAYGGAQPPKLARFTQEWMN